MRPRVLSRSGQFSAETTVVGHRARTPVIIGPAAQAGMAHSDGERALCRAAAKHGMIYCMSANATLTPEDVAEEADPDQVLFYQVYIAKDRSQTVDLLRRVERLGYKAIVLTVDSIHAGRRIRYERAAQRDQAKGSDISRILGLLNNAMAQQGVASTTSVDNDTNIDWSDIAFVSAHTSLPIIIKGISTAEDALLACAHDVAAIWISNHGGRNLEDAPGPAHVLLELKMHVPKVFDKMEVIVDGGIRNGIDILKALCLGAKAVAVARPFMYGLAYGELGVDKVAQILDEELATSGRLLGVTRTSQLGPQYINTRRLEAEIPTAVPLDMSQVDGSRDL